MKFPSHIKEMGLTLREGRAAYPGELALEGLRKIGPNNVQYQGCTESL